LVFVESVKQQFYIFFFHRFVLESYGVAYYYNLLVDRSRFNRDCTKRGASKGFNIRKVLWEYDTTLKYW